MAEDKDWLEKKIRKAKHQSKPDEASLVVYDNDGRWLFEMYDGSRKDINVNTKK